MTTLYLLRHAQSHPNAQMHTSKWPLSDLGKKQSETIVPALERLNIARIFSSPYQRCLDTVESFASTSKIEIQVHSDLRECHLSHTFITRKEQFIEEWEKSWQNFDYAHEDGESNRSGQDRVLRVLTHLAITHESSRILISTHGNLISLILHKIVEEFDYQKLHEIRNPDLFKIDWAEGRLSLDPAFNCSKDFDNLTIDSSLTPIKL